MSEKMKNFIVRTVTGVLFVAVMVSGICLRGDAMILLFTLITGLTLWEYTGLVNEVEDITVNRFISTAAGIYLFLAFAGYCADCRLIDFDNSRHEIYNSDDSVLSVYYGEIFAFLKDMP